MAATKRRGHEGRRVVWPWSDRGRSAVTRESVERDIAELASRVDVNIARAAGLVRL
jgi:hypothetical protein